MATELQWWHIVVPLASGGFAGSIATAFVGAFRNRIQPVGRRIDILPVFKQDPGGSSLQAKITVSEGANEYHFHNLFLATIQVVNKGNRDIEEFEFGMTLHDGDKAVYVEHETPDRHHVVAQTVVKPDNPKEEVDLRLTPFNRRDAYTFKLYVVVPASKGEPSAITLSSPKPIRFTEMPTIGEIVSQAAATTSLRVGPFRVLFRS